MTTMTRKTREGMTRMTTKTRDDEGCLGMTRDD